MAPTEIYIGFQKCAIVTNFLHRKRRILEAEVFDQDEGGWEGE